MMKTRRSLMKLSLALLIFCVSSAVALAEPAPQKIIDLANTKIAAYGTDPVIVAAVKAQNAKGTSLAEIQAFDKKWMATPGVADFMKALMDSDAGKHVIALRNSQPYFAEIFVMDNQGANVAQSDKTSDYWQGDEAKFKKSFNDGQGAVFVDDVEFDASSQAYLVQVSVPVMDGGKAIGAITFGIDVDKVK